MQYFTHILLKIVRGHLPLKVWSQWCTAHTPLYISGALSAAAYATSWIPTGSHIQKIQFQPNACLLLVTMRWSEFTATWMLRGTPDGFLNPDESGGTLIEKVKHNLSPFSQTEDSLIIQTDLGIQIQDDTGVPAPLMRIDETHYFANANEGISIASL